MIFSSPLFVIYFLPVFLILYWVVPKDWKNATAFLGSLVFYSWGAPIFSLLLLVSGTTDYVLSFRLNREKAKLWLAFGLTYNIGTLFVFKYFNFFIDNARVIANTLGVNFPHLAEIALPIGISFFTFQKISYLIDVYRGDSPRVKTLLDYLLFVFLFPQLIAGPILRYKELATQIIYRDDHENWAFRLSGFLRFVIGLSKKVLIADMLAPIADAGFTSNPDPTIAWLSLIAYAIQIYFDFSGYSDMALGLGEMMGFIFPENFWWPYQASCFREFWQRWHMTLSHFMRDYLYIPLGGNKVGKWLNIRNLGIVFLLSGLWHGASWNFVIWGIWHGAFMTLERLTGVFRKLPASFSTILTFVLVTMGWVWFRADSLSDSLAFFHSLAAFEIDENAIKASQATALVVALVFSFLPHKVFENIQNVYLAKNNWFDLLKVFSSLILLTLCLGAMGISDGQPFIYFRF